MGTLLGEIIGFVGDLLGIEDKNQSGPKNLRDKYILEGSKVDSLEYNNYYAPRIEFYDSCLLMNDQYNENKYIHDWATLRSEKLNLASRGEYITIIPYDEIIAIIDDTDPKVIQKRKEIEETKIGSVLKGATSNFTKEDLNKNPGITTKK